MERSTRPQRNRRHSKRAWPPEEEDAQHTRPAKMLFTPEIKRYLKDWLVRRRNNPYPTRDEKKRLAIETGLTYTQICNWFANWRRKLKNSEREKAKQSWGHLIKNYNTKAKGNVEQFSISSADSIWEEERMMDRQSEDDDLESHDEYSSGSYVERSGGSDGNYSWIETVVPRANFYADSSTELGSAHKSNGRITSNVASTLVGARLPNAQPKYKQQMMEKYLRDTTNSVEASSFVHHAHALETSPPGDSGTELNKWLVSAARFTPNKNNYHIEWNTRRQKHETADLTRIDMVRSGSESSQHRVYNVVHHKDELDAAEALTSLAFNCRQRLITAVTHPLQHVMSS